MLIDMTLGMRGSYYSESLGRQIRSSFRQRPYLAEITERNFGFDESKAQLSMQVIFVLAALVAVNGDTCASLKEYSEKIDPVVCTQAMRLPNYEDASTFYQCYSNRTYTVKNCSSGSFFNMAMQECMSCASYFPSAECGSLKVNATCVPITASPTAAPNTTTVAPTPSTTAAPEPTPAPSNSTTATTEAPGETTTQSVPTPPTDSPATTASTTSTTNNDDIITPSGTTISVPQPPSPGESNVPTPVTAAPTAPTIKDSPPTAPSAAVAK
ncbi:peritrophin-55 [Drosophila subpulchrella]|uniref:peritrophin-55 n=1 Tax=Drosophila subpulchrella TaxID=1486046 RepID=UPI0018A17EAA|nr:peritrophin-55 [Drosophila subpulchrella]